MEGRDTASFPPSACPLRRGSEEEARLGSRDGDGADAALARSLIDTAEAQLCTAALVLVLGWGGGQSCGPDLAKSETSARLHSARTLVPRLGGAAGIYPGEIKEGALVLLCFIIIFNIASG